MARVAAFAAADEGAGAGQTGLSFLIDWKPVKRVDIYAGVLLSNVYGGLANGFYSTSTVVIPGTTTVVSANTARTQNYDPTVGIRIRFWPRRIKAREGAAQGSIRRAADAALVAVVHVVADPSSSPLLFG